MREQFQEVEMWHRLDRDEMADVRLGTLRNHSSDGREGSDTFKSHDVVRWPVA